MPIIRQLIVCRALKLIARATRQQQLLIAAAWLVLLVLPLAVVSPPFLHRRVVVALIRIEEGSLIDALLHQESLLDPNGAGLLALS